MVQHTALNDCSQDGAKEDLEITGKVREFQNQKLVDTLLLYAN